ncbi:MAG: energy transducer TonB, partial [Bdellovibrionales bacterium]|nr:energy transducer TonB [Bdellovibrionales bacterium]
PPAPTPRNIPGGMGEAHGSPQLISAPKPPYPRRARRLGFEGSVVLKASIAETGKVAHVDIVHSSGRTDCDESAQQTILKYWKFQPATLFGKGVASVERIEVTFTLY